MLEMIVGALIMITGVVSGAAIVTSVKSKEPNDD